MKATKLIKILKVTLKYHGDFEVLVNERGKDYYTPVETFINGITINNLYPDKKALLLLSGDTNTDTKKWKNWEKEDDYYIKEKIIRYMESFKYGYNKHGYKED